MEQSYFTSFQTYPYFLIDTPVLVVRISVNSFRHQRLLHTTRNVVLFLVEWQNEINVVPHIMSHIISLF